MKKDSDFTQNVRTAASRVLRIKAEYLKREDHVPFNPSSHDIIQDIPENASKQFFFGQAARSTTMIRQSVIPVPVESRLLFCGLYSDFRKTGETMFGGESLKVPYSFK